MKIDNFFEPFAGSAAISLAVATQQSKANIWLNDINKPLANLWQEIVDHPTALAEKYERLWFEQLRDPKSFFIEVRERFNREKRAEDFLYLLARCVKGAIRYNSQREFNQSADHRRLGTKPERMLLQLSQTSVTLKGRTKITSVDYRDALTSVTKTDIVYLDPPYQGVSDKRDNRYLSGLDFEEFVVSVRELVRKDIPLIISYDGKTGEKIYGNLLPEDLGLTHFYLNAGKSTSSTLLGKTEQTLESLYVSSSLLDSGIKQVKLVQ